MSAVAGGIGPAVPGNGKPLLEVAHLSAGYGEMQVLRSISLTVRQAEIVAMVGGNGAGKTTLLRAISRLIPSRGDIAFDGHPLAGTTADDVFAMGLVQVPEGRQLFDRMSVEENLRMGAYRRRDTPAITHDLDRMYAIFPRLADRRRQLAGSMSGGEQQMCAIGRALMSDPRLLLLDEPSAGLAPLIVQQVFDLVTRIRAGGLTVLIVEQNVQQVLRVVDRAYLLKAGRLRASGSAAELLATDSVREAYLGV